MKIKLDAVEQYMRKAPKESDSAMTMSDAAEVPIEEQCRSVPKEWRVVVDVAQYASRNVPYGRMLHEAADAIASLRAERDALKAHREAQAGWLAQYVIDHMGGTNDLPAWVKRSADYYAEALAKAERAEAERDALRHDSERHVAIAAEECARAERAEADAARLDWMQAQWAHGLHVEVYAKSMRPTCYEPAATVFARKDEYRGSTIRAAIDRAIAAEKESHS